MGLNPHLINLMSIRERQRLGSLSTPMSSDEVGGSSFAKALDEKLALASQSADGRNLSKMEQAVQLTATPESSVSTTPKLAPNQILSAENLVQRFVNEQDLALAAQRAPEGRLRNTPSDDTSGEAGTRANLRPIE